MRFLYNYQLPETITMAHCWFEVQFPQIKWTLHATHLEVKKYSLPHEIPHDIMRNSSWKLLFDLRWTLIVSGLRCSFHLRTLHFRWSVCVLHSSLIESMNECSKYMPASKMIAYFLSQELHYNYLYSPSGDADTI